MYPGFDSYYEEGGWGSWNTWTIDRDNGRTFEETLNYTHHEEADFIQLITWNDFGEGTAIEPTAEYGFMYLQMLQQYTGVEFEAEDFYISVDLYNARKTYAGNEEAQYMLDRSFEYMKQKEFRRVRVLLQAVEEHFNPTA